MKTRTAAVFAAALSCALPCLSPAQQEFPLQTGEQPPEVVFSQKNMGGPRLGFAYVPGNTELAQRMEEEGIGRVISQFGWHFEHCVIASGNGPAFVIEFIPLLGGVEFGKPVISLSLLFGIRMPSGYEFGVGPNLLLAKSGRSGLVIAGGRTFDVQGVSIPMNIAYATSPVGSRVAFMVGYAI